MAARFEDQNPSSRPLLEFDGITQHFGGLTAVDSCSFSIREGGITGLIGPNGAGKTTAFNVIAGLHFPQRGRVVFGGEDITRLPAWQRQTKGMSRTFQLASEFGRMSVLENLMVAAENAAGERLLQAIFQPRRATRRERQIAEQAQTILGYLGLAAQRNELAMNLSGGQKKLLELARALMQSPRLILLDEIGAGVNRTLLAKIADKIIDLNRNQGHTFCLIEHDLDFIATLCDWVVVMAQGRVLAEGPIEVIRDDQRVIDAYFGAGAYTGE